MTAARPGTAPAPPGPVRRGTVAVLLAILDIVGYAVLGVIGLMNFGPELTDPVSLAMFGGAVAAFSLMGALLMRRVPANPIGALLLAVGTAQTAGLGLLTYGGLGAAAVTPWPGADIASAFSEVWYIAPFVIALIGIPLVFPDGRLPSRHFRWVVWVAGAGLGSLALAGLASLIPDLSNQNAIINVLASVTSTVLFIIGLGGAVAAISVRFRRGDAVQRQQIKWLLAIAGVAAVGFPLALVSGPTDSAVALAFWGIGFLAYLALPVAIAIAVLRYRLYEIDRLISRTIGYALVTVALAAVFVGAILLLEAVLASLTAGNTVAVVASTLVVAAVFRPVQRRVQRVVDRRFDRSRYDAERMVAAFAAQLRDEVDLERLGADVLEAVVKTFAPATAGLWLARGGKMTP